MWEGGDRSVHPSQKTSDSDVRYPADCWCGKISSKKENKKVGYVKTVSIMIL